MSTDAETAVINEMSQYPPGARGPKLADLAAAAGLPVRKALQVLEVLESRGLVERRKVSGVYRYRKGWKWDS